MFSTNNPDSTQNTAHYIYPSAGRRVLCMVLYALGLFGVVSILSSILVSIDCLYSRQCSNADRVIDTVLSASWVATTIYACVQAWRGQIYGCRKKEISNK